jgi:molecular chaperone GrpE
MTDEPIQQGEAQKVEEQQEPVVQEDAPETPQASPVSGPGVGGSAADASSHDRLLRLAADFDNYKKRAARERSEYIAQANERLLKELLPILDDLERALQAAEQHEEAQLEEGVALVHKSLVSLLERNGVSEIAADGKFDPHVHEALLAQPAEDKEQGDVVDVLQKGYKLGDRVVRPARVIVAE